jgi:poly-gamma-glutamate synthesis protein (capsule biosynthesis protein)
VQPIEQVNGVWTVFGMGNVLSNHPTRDFFPPSSQDGVIVTVTIEVSADGQVTVARPVAHPTWVDRRNGYVIRDVLEQLARPDLPAGMRTVYAESLERTRRMVGDFFPAS